MAENCKLLSQRADRSFDVTANGDVRRIGALRIHLATPGRLGQTTVVDYISRSQPRVDPSTGGEQHGSRATYITPEQEAILVEAANEAVAMAIKLRRGADGVVEVLT